jgi:hypothetical protein
MISSNDTRCILSNVYPTPLLGNSGACTTMLSEHSSQSPSSEILKSDYSNDAFIIKSFSHSVESGGHRPQIIVTPRKVAAAVEAAIAASSRTVSEAIPITNTFNFADLVLPGRITFL